MNIISPNNYTDPCKKKGTINNTSLQMETRLELQKVK